jgi:hypothetical protein
MGEALEAPVPYIFGLTKATLDNNKVSMPLLNETCFVNLSTATVSLPSACPPVWKQELLKKQFKQTPSMECINLHLAALLQRALQLAPEQGWDHEEAMTR